MSTLDTPRTPARRRPVHLAVAAFALAAGLAVTVAPSASAAQRLVVVPPGCGSLSGTMVSASRLDDHSADPAPLGDVNGLPYDTLNNVAMITIGTVFRDHIRGNGVSETICGLDGDDLLKGGTGGLDVIYGDAGLDEIWGEAANDQLSGGLNRDTIYGDDPTNSHGNTDGNDDIAGGQANHDFADGGFGADTCSTVEDGPC